MIPDFMIPDYTTAYILFTLSILSGIISYQLWKREKNERKSRS